MNSLEKAFDDIRSIATPTGASFNRGKSKQDYATPLDFRHAVIHTFGCPTFDLAADRDNVFSSSGRFFGLPESDSLEQEWSDIDGLLWLNPPFDRIEPWAKKCAEEAELGAEILFLVPAAIGSNWFRDYVYGRAQVIAVNGRLCFDGKAPYPKDVILCHYGPLLRNFVVWNWKTRKLMREPCTQAQEQPEEKP